MQGHSTAIDGVDAFGVHMSDTWPDHGVYPHVPWGEFLAGFHNALALNGVAMRVSARPIM